MKRLSPAKPIDTLALANYLSAGIGLVPQLIVARVLGPTLFGTSAVLISIQATVMNLFDVRLGDIFTLLYCRPEAASDETYRVSVVRGFICLTFVLALLFFAGGVAANVAFAQRFTAVPVEYGWIFAAAFSLSTGYFLGPFTMLQRMSGDLAAMARLRIYLSLLSAAILLVFFYFSPTLGGYYAGLGVSALCVLSLTVFYTERMSADTHKALRNGFRAPGGVRAFLAERHFLFWGNILGYIKLAHRAADTLVVAFFAGEAGAGVYRVARELTEKLYLLFEATMLYYQPELLRRLAAKEFEGYKETAAGIMRWTFVFVMGLLALQALFSHLLFSWLLPAYAGIEWAVAFLTLPFLYVNGFHVWLWPAIQERGLVMRFAWICAAAVAAQYAGGYLLFLTLSNTALGFAAGYAIYYAVALSGAYLLLKPRVEEIWPPGVRHV